jgi:LPS-assembly protein
MRNNLFLIIFFIFFSKINAAENLDISARNITLDKKNSITIFENDVVVKDEYKNIIKSEYAIYNDNLKSLEIKGDVSIITNEGYSIEAQDINLDKNKNIILSKKPAIITDIQKNKIYTENFEYQPNNNIFKSIGEVKVIDVSNNVYMFSQIYIDEKKKELIGSDSKVFFNQAEFKANENNKPRIFSNSVSIKNKESKFIKSTFTTCDYRKDDKCPPWELTAKEIRHDNIQKTIYYKNAIIRVYNVPIFYSPILSYPDPTVKRRSGFLIPSYTDTKNLGSGINLPYFWAIDEDKDFTFQNKLYATEHPLFLSEYRQAFRDSNLFFDFGYTQGYKNSSALKKLGDKSHFFSRFVKRFQHNDTKESNLEINLQEVSDKKYLKLYRIKSNLVDNYEVSTLENYINYNYFDDEQDLFLDLKASIYTDISDTYNDKYEYILPEINLNKNLYSDKFGSGSFNTSIKIHNYDTNKYENFFVNDFNWTYGKTFSDFPYDGKILTNLKNVNYESENVSKLKEDTSHEIYGALGYLASIDLVKPGNENFNHLLKPKILLKYSPNHMKKETGDHSLHRKNIFSLDRLNSSSNYEGGTSLTYGFDYNQTGPNKLNFTIGQIINEKKNNKNMPDSSSLDNRFSNIVGNFNYNKGDNFKIDYNYSLDQNLKETNYNEVNTDYTLGDIKFNLNYLEENNTADTKEYFKSTIEIKKGQNGLFSFSNKRNIITSSSEFYNLSYEYINDCLRAGLVYRREFYNDSELEAENSLMFKVTLSPFGSIASPQFNQ